MPLVDDADVQIHLPVDKLKVEEIPDDLSDAKRDAERIVRGYLTGSIDPLVLASWTTPATTPETIRAIAGRLAAALIYRIRYSEATTEFAEYAQMLYNEAMEMLQQIVAGTLDIPGVETPQFDNSYFTPNDLTGEPKFAMDDVY
jgi:hypothetical protein